MKRRNFIKSAGMGIAASAAIINQSYSANKPNVIMIMADDIGYECYGCYGSKHYQTPNIDELARTGVKFTHAYSLHSWNRK